MDTFYGRERELCLLKEQANSGKASLIVIRGRRRIGKSRLAEQFRTEFANAFTFIGLPPEDEVTAEMERQHFANELERQTQLSGMRTDDWDFLFHNLAQFTKTGKVLILLDEINWMGTKDPAFLGKLKTAWDNDFKKNPELVLVLSGSMSSWIEQSILNSTGYFGRADLDIVLKELSLPECEHFWDGINDKISDYEKFKILCVTGGVPRYLEAINPKLSAEENIRRLFLRKEALFFKEFKQIFSDIFSKRAPIYEKIVRTLAKGPLDQNGILKKLNWQKSGVYSQYFEDLVKTGYISRDKTWTLKQGKFSKLSQYRLSDNYLRFYLKYIEPLTEDILQDRAQLPANWHSILGLQFENLVLNNRKLIQAALGIRPEEVCIDNPFFARATKHQAGVQIDYLIQTKFNNLYLCEIKFHQDKIGLPVIKEVQDKVTNLQLPRGFSLRTVLIHVNGVSDQLLDENYFSHIIDFSTLLRG